jgi:hypothetical protein
MSINRIAALVIAVAVLLLPIAGAYAGGEAPSYVELKDAPTIAVDWSKGTTQAMTLGGNRTLTFSNGQKGGRYVLVITQDATGSRTVTWPASVRWPGYGGRLTLTSLAKKTDYITFFYNGVTYDAVAFSQNY